MDIKKIWQWLRDPDNQGALKIVGGAIAALCLATWTLFIFYKQNDNTPPLHPKSEKEISIPSTPEADEKRQTTPGTKAAIQNKKQTTKKLETEQTAGESFSQNSPASNPPPDKKTDTSSKKSGSTVNQTMSNSPGGVQVGRDLNINVNTDRRMSKTAADIMIQGLKSAPCPITIGVLGLGGEPDRLANDLYQIARQTGGEVHGVNHGVGFEVFTGIQVRYSPTNTPQVALSAITNALKADKLDFIAGADPGQPPGSIYIFVGYKP